MALDYNAYCDESVTDHHVFVIAGCLGTGDQWARFEADWRAVLDGESLSEFHAYDCEKHKGEFENWSLVERKRVFRRFLTVIRDSPIRRYCTVIDLEPYEQHAQTIKNARRPGYGDPYFLAFQHQIEALANALDGQGPSEKLVLTFDQRKQDQGKAKILYDSLFKAPIPFVSRLGAISFAVSEDLSGLQAADVLAYEANQYSRRTVFAPKPAPPRWQWRMLRSGVGLTYALFDRHGVDQYVDAITTPTGSNTIRLEAT